MKTSSRIVAAALVAATPFTLAACGTSTADHAKASIKASVLNDKDSKDFKLTDSQAGCFADTVVDKIGVKQLQAYNLVDAKGNAVNNSLDNAKLSQADAQTLVNAMFNCTNGGQGLVDAAKKSISSEASGADATTVTCIESKLTTDVVKRLLVAEYSGGNTDQIVETVAAGCGSGN